MWSQLTTFRTLSGLFRNSFNIVLYADKISLEYEDITEAIIGSGPKLKLWDVQYSWLWFFRESVSKGITG